MTRRTLVALMLLLLLPGFFSVARADERCGYGECKNTVDPEKGIRCPCGDLFCSWSCYDAAHRVKRFGHCKSCGATIEMGPPPQPVQVAPGLVRLAPSDQVPEYCNESCHQQFNAGKRYRFRQQAPGPNPLNDPRFGGEYGPAPAPTSDPGSAPVTPPPPVVPAPPVAHKRSAVPFVVGGAIFALVIGGLLLLGRRDE